MPLATGSGYVARRKQKPSSHRVTRNDKAGTTQVSTDYPPPSLGQLILIVSDNVKVLPP
jgi:hypothetical protein